MNFSNHGEVNRPGLQSFSAHQAGNVSNSGNNIERDVSYTRCIKVGVKLCRGNNQLRPSHKLLTSLALHSIRICKEREKSKILRKERYREKRKTKQNETTNNKQQQQQQEEEQQQQHLDSLYSCYCVF